MKYILAIFLLAATPHVATVYVSPGDSLQKAVNAAKAGDTLILRDGTSLFSCPTLSSYAVAISVPSITIKAEHQGKAILDAQNTCHSLIQVARSSGSVVLDGLVLTRGYTAGINSQSSHNQFLRLDIHHIGNVVDTNPSGGHPGILTHPETTDTLIEDVSIHDIGRTNPEYAWHDHPVYGEGQNVRIRKSRFWNFHSGWALALKVGGNYLVEYNSFFGPAGAGREGQIVIGDSLGGSLAGIVIRFNNFVNPKGAAVVTCAAAFSGINSIDHNTSFGVGLTILGSDVCGTSKGLASINQSNNTVIAP